MSTQSEKLISLLKELFQTDQAELDFGMYKVINQRRDEINRFLEEKLLPQIKDAFSTYQSVDTKILQNELIQAMRQAEDLGVDPDTSSKVKGIREQIATYSVDVNDLENQVYSNLYNFFRRYYDEGDFISQRRYKEGVYAIPYEGEEVKLYWANHDQYYIKTSEYFRDYSFKLPSGKRAHFKLVEADTEKDNRKEIDDSKCRFVLAEDPLAWQDGEVVIRFEFRPEKVNQTKCNEKTLITIFDLRKDLDEQSQKDALTELAHPAPTEGNPDRTLLEKHLEDYTRRNTQDYFIHKDLGKFLRRELDFYIKNEVMHLDNIENENAPRVEEYLSKIKVIRQIAHKIIDFLAQIEDFQKKLWLKKKFVVETNYCITLDRIPEELYPEIAANDAQREEWVRLFTINKIKKDSNSPGYSNPLTIEFLKTNPFLVLDTKFFDQNFKYKILTSFEDIHESLDGLLIHSENLQALRLLSTYYENKVKTIYIDPPYNTEKDRSQGRLLYKDGFEHSSWLTLLFDRLLSSSKFLSNDGAIFCSIDDNENFHLRKLLDYVFGDENYLYETVWSLGTGTQAGHFTRAHEYIQVYAKNKSEYPSFKSTKEGNITHGALKKISRANPASEITFPKGVEFEGSDAVFSGEIGGSEKEIIKGEMIFKDGKLDKPATIEAGWAMKNQLLSWLEGKETYDTKGQKLIRFYFNSQGILWYEKERGTEHPPSVFSGVASTKDGSNELEQLVPNNNMSFPKPSSLIKRIMKLSTTPNSIVLDYFAGSGTTAQSIIDMKRESNNDVFYILIEMGEHFHNIMMPRIQRTIYSREWKNGKPISRKGITQAFKYIQLESYEDTLNNLALNRPETAQTPLLDETSFCEDYLLHYMLDFESQGSLLDLERFETPFDYQLQIASNTVGETEATPVDLVETFNYLLGLHVKSIRKIEGTVVVRGTTQDEKQVLVIWRTVSEMDNDQLNTFFEAHLASESQEITDIYVNGDNNLANIRPDDQHWTVHLTEESFHRLMFEG